MATTSPVRVTTRTPARKTSDRYTIFGKPDEAEAVEDGHFKALKEYTGRRQISDPFQNEYGTTGASHMVLEPNYSFYALMRLPDENSMLRQCIDAMVTNVDGHGYQLEYVGPEGAEDSPEAQAEKTAIEELLEFPNDEYTLQDLRDRLRRDLETLGNAYIEVGFGTDEKVVMLSHIPAHTMRMTRRDADAVPVDVHLPRGGKTVKQKTRKRFRRFVQLVGTRRVYFKEHGDPRIIDPQSGQENNALRPEASATSVIHLSFYNPGSPYGLPRWFNQMPAILGSRQSELTNLDFFKDNAIPAMAVMVSGGTLTQDTVDDLERHFNAVRGREAANRVLMIEATGDEEASAENGQISPPRLELKPLVDGRQGDALFQDYEKNNRDKIRSSFRLPPLFVGLSEDMTYATAKTAYEVAESQVFAPERQKFDDMVNLKILTTFETENWRFRSNPPRLSDPQDIMQAISAFDEVGALTPNIAIEMANGIFDMQIEKVEAEWGNYPFEVVKSLISAGRIKLEDLENSEGNAASLGNLIGNLPPPAADDDTKGNRALDLEEGTPGEDADDADDVQKADATPEGLLMDHLYELRRVVKDAQRQQAEAPEDAA